MPKAREPRFPEVVYANASPRSIGGMPLFDAARPPGSSTVMSYYSEEAVVRQAADRLRKAGFQAGAAGGLDIRGLA